MDSDRLSTLLSFILAGKLFWKWFQLLCELLYWHRITVRSHRGSALTLLIYFEFTFPNWIVGSIVSRHWRYLRQKLKNCKLFKHQHRPYANTLAQTLSNCVHATSESNVIGCCTMKFATAPSFRHTLRKAQTRVKATLECLLKWKCLFLFIVILL